jgi:hypothetical protein
MMGLLVVDIHVYCSVGKELTEAAGGGVKKETGGKITSIIGLHSWRSKVSTPSL